jgi:hypothetical protein
MSFPTGHRVVLRRSHTGIPAGSIGTAANGSAATTSVEFDASPKDSVVVPNTWLALATTRVPATKQQVLWHPPHVVTPGVGTAANFVAVTATPNVLSLLTQNAEVALRGAATSGCWIGSLEFPVAGGPATLSVDVRGFANQAEGAQTSIFIIVGAVLKSIAFDGARSGNFLETFTATISDAPVQTITIVLLAERPAAGQDDLLLLVDALDIVTA